MSAAGAWFITPHAVRRYIERIAPGLTYEQALGALVRLSTEAQRVRDIAPGLALYRGPKPLRVRLRVATGEGDELPQLVTVLPCHDGWRPRC